MAWERPRICPNLLLVEGAEDLKTIPYIMEANGVTWPDKPPKAPVWIEQYEGYSNLLKPETLELELKTNGLEVLGMIIDADTDASHRWQETRQSCRVSIPDLPEDLPQSGLIHTTEGGIKFGLWMMPDNTSRGMLETFLSLMIPDDRAPLWEYAQEATEAAKRLGAAFVPTHTDKAHIYTWLAWQKPPGQPFPYALKDRILDPSHPNAEMFITWFKTLYSL
jgi:hypothetical protein